MRIRVFYHVSECRHRTSTKCAAGILYPVGIYDMSSTLLARRPSYRETLISLLFRPDSICVDEHTPHRYAALTLQHACTACCSCADCREPRFGTRAQAGRPSPLRRRTPGLERSPVTARQHPVFPLPPEPRPRCSCSCSCSCAAFPGSVGRRGFGAKNSATGAAVVGGERQQRYK